ncbi:MAG: NTP transferase domain-containing protein, partial [Phycisphaerae bacterium]
MTRTTERVGGIVLCGGQSRRMGTPKAWLSFGSEFLLCRVVRIVSEVVSPVVVVGRKGQDLPPLPSDVQTLHDRIADSGPLAGIDVGFEALTDRCSAAFVTSCDHPLLTASVVMRMVDWLGDAPGVVPSHENRLYPLTAVYALTTHDLLRQFLADRRLLAHEFAASCGA